MGEFDIIEQFFTRPSQRAVLGVGDDCALLQPRPGMQLAISSDMLVSGQHFFADVDPAALGHKALAVNLSDLAACGAEPLAFTLALALPQIDLPWLQAFSDGLFALADLHHCELIGGDTTRGPLCINITIFGEVAPGQALLRSGAMPGDDIYVSGTLGDARIALEALQGQLTLDPQQLAALRPRLERPTPRVALGRALRGIASAAIDISDGLWGDLQHILKRSHVGGTLDVPCLETLMQASGFSYRYALAGGDDYELAFTAAPHWRNTLAQYAHSSQTPITRIGQIDAAPGLRLRDAAGELLQQTVRSFDHFL
jgi:thiamine-monophosphate kinase